LLRCFSFLLYPFSLSNCGCCNSGFDDILRLEYICHILSPGFNDTLFSHTTYHKAFHGVIFNDHAAIIGGTKLAQFLMSETTKRQRALIIAFWHGV
jgi:hypothetical protein